MNTRPLLPPGLEAAAERQAGKNDDTKLPDDLYDVVYLFGAYITSMEKALKDCVDMRADILYGVDWGERQDYREYKYMSCPLVDLSGKAMDKDRFEKMYSIMAFFVDKVLGAANIYLTNREDKLVIEIAW